MPPSSQASWRSVRGDQWWWSGNPALSGSLNQAISVFSIDDTFDGTVRQLWTVLDATARQFPHLQIQCAYDARTKDVLDQLQDQGLLRWTDVRNPCSRYAGIELVQGSTTGLQCNAGDQAQGKCGIGRSKSAGGSTAAVPWITLFAAGMLILISGAAALLRGINDSYGYSRSDDFLAGAARCAVGLICIAVSAVGWRRKRLRRDAARVPGEISESASPR
jgi:hypothetical protein